MQMLKLLIRTGNASWLGPTAHCTGLRTWKSRHVFAIRAGFPCASRKLSTNAPRRFTLDEDRIILNRRKEGTTFLQTAAELGRSPDVVRTRYSARLVHRDPSAPLDPPKGRVFAPADDDLIVRLCKEGKNRTDIATTLSLPYHAISRRIRAPLRDRLSELPEHRAFTPAEDAQILRLRAAGNFFSHIARNISRHWACVRDRYHGLTKPQPLQASMMRPWSEMELGRLLDLQHEGLSCPEIASRIGRSRHSVRGKLRQQLIMAAKYVRLCSASQREELLLLRDKDGLSFGAIAERMPHRTVRAVKKQYYHLKRQVIQAELPAKGSVGDVYTASAGKQSAAQQGQDDSTPSTTTAEV